MFGQGPDVILGAFDVRAGFRVAPFGQAGHGVNGGFLGQGQLPGAFVHQFLEMVAVAFEFQLVGHAAAHQRSLKGLFDIILRAQGKALGLVDLLVLGRDEHDRDVAGARRLLESAADFIAVHAGHDHVQQNNVRRGFAAGQAQGVPAVFGKHDGIVPAQAFTQNAQVFRSVVHDQHAAGRGNGVGSKAAHDFFPRISGGSFSAR